jgi:hypothetical protein
VTLSLRSKPREGKTSVELPRGFAAFSASSGARADPSRFGGVSSPLADGWSLEKLSAVVREMTRAVTVDSVSIVETGSNCTDTVNAVTKLVQLLEKSHE